MKPLEGFKIIDFTRLLPGPLATHLLAQMGAEIIKIESPKRMDYVREGIKKVEGVSHLFHQLNHNKQLKILDYNEEAGKNELLSLIKEADALIEQFRPGAMDAWGLGYEELKEINPKLVYVSVTGYGQSGTFKNEAGHDFNYLAQAGIMSMLKDEKGKPTVPDTQFADICGSYTSVMALQAALLKRSQTGKGSFVDVALCDSVMPFLAVPYSFHAAGLDYRLFNVINGKLAVNYSAYQCADDKWLSVAALEMKFWNNICQEVGREDWKRKHQMELMNHVFPRQEVIDLFKSKSRDEWAEFFKGKDVCIAPILELEELEDFPYHKENRSFEEIETEGGTQMKTIALPFSVREE